MFSAFHDLGRPAKQIFYATAPQVVFKDPIGIKQITDNQIEARKIICQLRWQLRIPREEARERPIFDGAYCLGVKSVFRKHGNVFVTKNLDGCMRTGVSQRLERRQRENEIANCAAADQQNAPEHRLLVCAPSRFATRFIKTAETVSAVRTGQSPMFLIPRKRERENHTA